LKGWDLSTKKGEKPEQTDRFLQGKGMNQLSGDQPAELAGGILWG